MAAIKTSKFSISRLYHRCCLSIIDAIERPSMVEKPIGDIYVSGLCIIDLIIVTIDDHYSPSMVQDISSMVEVLKLTFELILSSLRLVHVHTCLYMYYNILNQYWYEISVRYYSKKRCYMDYIVKGTSSVPVESIDILTPHTAGIFYRDPAAIPMQTTSYIFKSFSVNPQPPCLYNPSFFSTPCGSILCSSLSGLLLFFNSRDDDYHPLNTFIQNASTSYRKISSPPRIHGLFTPVILSIHEQELANGAAVFPIICAIHGGNNRYTFNRFFCSNEWYSEKGSIDISPSCRLKENTCVSNDLVIAFWLTDDQRAVIRSSVRIGKSSIAFVAIDEQQWLV